MPGSVDSVLLLNSLVEASEAIASTSSRIDKVKLLAEILSTADADDLPVAISFLSGRPRQRALGMGPALVYSVEPPSAEHPSIAVGEVDRVFATIASQAGPGSTGRRRDILGDLLGRATSKEQDFLRRLMLRNLRQGSSSGLMAEAIAAVSGSDLASVRREAMVTGDLVAAASRLMKGDQDLAAPTTSLFRPVQPMLAKSAPTPEDAMEAISPALVDQKLDGLRIQVHRSDEGVAVYTRNLRDVTDQMPAVVEVALALEGGSAILDGEALATDAHGRPLPFQDSMSRGREGSSAHLQPFFFDLIHLDGLDLFDTPLSVRREKLESLVPERHRVGSTLVRSGQDARSTFDLAVSKGYEGIVVKDPAAGYEAGRRGSSWLKVKPTHTLDLVILAVEWGSGRRKGWLSNLHLGARDESGGFVMLGKTFKGLTDEMLEWQTKHFLSIETGRSGHVVHVEPTTVYEVAFDGVQRSTRYPGGVALRFARVRGHRPDKSADSADDIETVRSFLR